MRSFLPAALVGLCLLLPGAARAVVMIQDFDGGGVNTGNSGLIFRQPGFSGSTGGNVQAGNTTTLSTDQSFSPTHSLKVDFDWTDNAATRWDRLTTSGSNPVISATDALTMRVYNASQDTLGFAIGVREVPYATDPALGSNVTGSGGIEWLGAVGATSGAPNVTHFIAPGSWQDLTFDPTLEPVTSFVGNGILEPTFGKVTLEHLAIRSPGTGNHVTFYIDDIRILPRSEVPEPGTLALLGTGLLPLLKLRRRHA